MQTVKISKGRTATVQTELTAGIVSDARRNLRRLGIAERNDSGAWEYDEVDMSMQFIALCTHIDGREVTWDEARKLTATDIGAIVPLLQPEDGDVFTQS